MKFSKISLLLVLPFFVLADNPVSPVDIDSASDSEASADAQVESRSVAVTGYDTSSSFGSDACNPFHW